MRIRELRVKAPGPDHIILWTGDVIEYEDCLYSIKRIYYCNGILYISYKFKNNSGNFITPLDKFKRTLEKNIKNYPGQIVYKNSKEPYEKIKTLNQLRKLDTTKKEYVGQSIFAAMS